MTPFHRPTRHRSLRHAVIGLMGLLAFVVQTGCASLPPGTVEIHLLPDGYRVDGRHYDSANAVIEHVQSRHPQRVRVTGCGLGSSVKLALAAAAAGDILDGPIELVMELDTRDCPN